MSDEIHPSQVHRRRLLVALDAADDAQLLLEAAAEMAVRMRADLAGLFVEDADLLGLGDNPLIRMVSAHAGATRSIATREIERALRRQVATIQGALERAAKARRIQASFEVRRGRLASAIEGMEEADLIVVRRGAGDVQHVVGSRRTRMSAATRQLLLAARRSVIVLDVRAGTAMNLVALDDGSPETERALAAAADIADRRGSDGITVLPLATDDEAAAELMQRATAFLAPYGHRPRPGPRVAPDVAAVGAAMRLIGPGLLVLDAGHALLVDDGMTRLLDNVECSVMVVR